MSLLGGFPSSSLSVKDVPMPPVIALRALDAALVDASAVELAACADLALLPLLQQLQLDQERLQQQPSQTPPGGLSTTAEDGRREAALAALARLVRGCAAEAFVAPVALLATGGEAAASGSARRGAHAFACGRTIVAAAAAGNSGTISEEALISACATLEALFSVRSAELIAAQKSGAALATAAAAASACATLHTASVCTLLSDLVSLAEVAVQPALEAAPSARYHRTALRAILCLMLAIVPVASFLRLSGRAGSSGGGAPPPPVLPAIFPGLFSCALTVLGRGIVLSAPSARSWQTLPSVASSQLLVVGGWAAITEPAHDGNSAFGSGIDQAPLGFTSLGRAGVAPLALRFLHTLLRATLAPAAGAPAGEDAALRQAGEQVTLRLAPLLRALCLCIRASGDWRASGTVAVSGDIALSGAASTVRALAAALQRLCTDLAALPSLRATMPSLAAEATAGLLLLGAPVLEVDSTAGGRPSTDRTSSGNEEFTSAAPSLLACVAACATLVREAAGEEAAPPTYGDIAASGWRATLRALCEAAPRSAPPREMLGVVPGAAEMPSLHPLLPELLGAALAELASSNLVRRGRPSAAGVLRAVAGVGAGVGASIGDCDGGFGDESTTSLTASEARAALATAMLFCRLSEGFGATAMMSRTPQHMPLPAGAIEATPSIWTLVLGLFSAHARDVARARLTAVPRGHAAASDAAAKWLLLPLSETLRLSALSYLIASDDGIAGVSGFIGDGPKPALLLDVISAYVPGATGGDMSRTGGSRAGLRRRPRLRAQEAVASALACAVETSQHFVTALTQTLPVAAAATSPEETDEAAATASAAEPTPPPSASTGDVALWGTISRRVAFKATLLAESAMWLRNVGSRARRDQPDEVASTSLSAAAERVLLWASTAAARWLCRDWDSSFDESLNALDAALASLETGGSTAAGASPSLAAALGDAGKKLASSLLPESAAVDGTGSRPSRLARAADGLCAGAAAALEASASRDAPAALLRLLGAGTRARSPLAERRAELTAAAGAALAGASVSRLASAEVLASGAASPLELAHAAVRLLAQRQRACEGTGDSNTALVSSPSAAGKSSASAGGTLAVLRPPLLHAILVLCGALLVGDDAGGASGETPAAAAAFAHPTAATMLPILLLEAQQPTSAFFGEDPSSSSGGASRSYAESQEAGWRSALVGTLCAYLDAQRPPGGSSPRRTLQAPAGDGAVDAPDELQQISAGVGAGTLSVDSGSSALAQLSASLTPAQALTLIYTAGALPSADDEAGSGGTRAQLAATATTVAAVAVAAQCCAATVWEAAVGGSRAGYGSAASLLDTALPLLASAAGRAAGLAALHGVPLSGVSAGALGVGVSGVAVAAAARGSGDSIGSRNGSSSDVAHVRAAMAAWSLSAPPVDTPGTLLHDAAETAALLSPRVVRAREPTTSADVAWFASSPRSADEAAAVRSSAQELLLTSQEAALGVTHLVLLLGWRGAEGATGITSPALERSSGSSGSARAPVAVPALSAELEVALERICSIEGLRAAEAGSPPALGLPPRVAESAQDIAARLDAVCRGAAASPVAAAEPAEEEASICRCARAPMLVVPPVTLLAPLLAMGRRCCSLLRELTPSALAAAASGGAAPKSTGTGPDASGGSAVSALASARLALAGLAHVCTALAAYPSVQHPFLAQNVWPAVAALLPSATWLRSASLALARHAATASRGSRGSRMPPSSSALLTGGSIAAATAASSHVSLVDAREAMLLRDASVARSGGIGNGTSLDVYGRTLQYLSARRAGAAAPSSSSAVASSAAPAPLQAQAASQLPPELSSPLVAGWLLSFGADVIEFLAALCLAPPCAACGARAGSSWPWHSRAPAGAHAVGRDAGGAPARIPLGGCAGDFLRSRAEADLVPVLLAALHAAIAQEITSPRAGGLAWGQPFHALTAAACRAVAALARPLLVVPRDDNDVPSAAAVAGEGPERPPQVATGAVPNVPRPDSASGVDEPLPPIMPLQFAAAYAKPSETGADARRTAVAAACVAAPSLLGEGVASSRPILASLSLLHSLGGGVAAEAACEPDAQHALVGEAFRALAGACEATIF